MKWYDPITRRQVLRGAGASLGLYLMPSILPRAFADESKIRLIAAFTANGKRGTGFYPEVDLNRDLGQARERLLREINGEMSFNLSEDFNALKEKLNIIENLSLAMTNRRAHSVNLMLGGYREDKPAIPNTTIDQILAYSNKVYTTSPQIRSLNLRCPGISSRSSDEVKTISFRKVGSSVQRVNTILNPKDAFNLVFGGSQPSTGNTGNTQAAAAMHANQKKIVDQVFGDYQSLKSNRRISSEDIQTLEAQMTFLSELQEKVNRSYTSEPVPPSSSCQVPQIPEISQTHNGSSIDSEANLRKHIDSQFDIIEAAIKCGHTRIATIMLNAQSDKGRYSFLGISKGFHDLSHTSSSSAFRDCGKIIRWYGQRVARFLKNLDQVENPSTGETYLDNSIFLWGDGQANGNHSTDNIPTLLAGGGAGYFKTGRYLKYDSSRAYNNLMVTILDAFGLGPQDYEQFNLKNEYNPDGTGFGGYARSNTKNRDWLAFTPEQRRAILPYLKKS